VAEGIELYANVLSTSLNGAYQRDQKYNFFHL
jgi:hypothetical protein